jgi:hypothetical protein
MKKSITFFMNWWAIKRNMQKITIGRKSEIHKNRVALFSYSQTQLCSLPSGRTWSLLNMVWHPPDLSPAPSTLCTVCINLRQNTRGMDSVATHTPKIVRVR